MNWTALMAIGLGQLRLSPEVFWSMTPRELAACTGGLASTVPMTREALERLAAQHPDTPNE